jgi:hypothetical protein
MRQRYTIDGAGGVTLKRFLLYQTNTRFYLVGCSDDGARAKVVKFDRTEPRELSVPPRAPYTGCSASHVLICCSPNRPHCPPAELSEVT